MKDTWEGVGRTISQPMVVIWRSLSKQELLQMCRL